MHSEIVKCDPSALNQKQVKEKQAFAWLYNDAMKNLHRDIMNWIETYFHTIAENTASQYCYCRETVLVLHIILQKIGLLRVL